MWHVPLAQVWTHYKIGKLNMWMLFCNVCINFWTTKYERKSCLNWIVSPQVLPHSQLIFPSKIWFFGIYLNFKQQKSLLNQYLPQSKSKSYQINSIKSCSSRSFQEHHRHIQIPLKLSATISFHFIEKIILTHSQVTRWNPLEGSTKSSCGKLRLGGTFPASNFRKG